MGIRASKQIWIARFLRRPTIRTSLVCLVLTTIVPLLAFITVVLTITVRLQERAIEERFVTTARALALAVERDLRTIEAALQVLARSSSLDTGDWDAFAHHAVEVGRLHGGWIVLSDRKNQQILNTAAPHGAALPPGARISAVDLVLETAQPTVSDLFVDEVLQRPVIAILVPVTRVGGVRFLLSMVLPPERIAALFTAQRFDPVSVALIVDRTGRMVARVPDGEKVGRTPAPEIIAALREERDGWARATTSGQATLYFAFARVTHAEWTVALGIPAELAYSTMKRSLHLILAGAAVALILAPVLALRFGRRIAAPLVTLAAAARRGDFEARRPDLDGTVAEVADLRHALHEATETQHREQLERQRRVDEEARRRVAEQTLAAVAASEERWRVLFEQASEAILVGDLAGVCRNANAAACDLVGFMAKELIDEPLSRLVSPAELRRIIEAFVALAPDGCLVDEWTLTRRNGDVIVVEANGRMLPDGRWQAFVRDVTARRRAEAERGRLLAVTQAARAEAEAASRTKDDFLATLSHELRTPLTVMVGWVRLLRSGKLDSTRAAHALEVIERNVEAQSVLIRDLLDLTRIIRGNLTLDLRQHSLSRVVTEACEAFTPEAEAKGIALERDIEEGIEGVCDANRVQQIVWNIVTNALKFTPPGGRVDVSFVRGSADDATLTVADTGRGIPTDFLPHVFERFRQLDVEGVGGGQGLGVGLAIVKHLVEWHRGTVTVESRGPGQGTTLTVTLPLGAVGRSRAGAPR